MLFWGNIETTAVIKDTNEQPDERDVQGGEWEKGHRASMLSLGATLQKPLHVQLSKRSLDPVLLCF